MKKRLWIFVIAAAMSHTSVFTAYAQEYNLLNEEHAKQLTELKHNLRALQRSYDLFFGTPGMEEGTTTQSVTPPFVQPNEGPVVPVCGIPELANNMTARQRENSYETAEFVFQGTIHVDFDLIQTMPYAKSFVSQLKPYGEDDGGCSSHSVLSQPIEELGRIKILFTSELKDAEGDVLEFSDPLWASITLARRDMNLNKLEVTISFDTDLPAETIKSGSIKMRLFQTSNNYHVTNIPLDSASKGNHFDLAGVKFTLSDYGPGDVVITSDTTSKSVIDKWEYVCLKNGEYVTANKRSCITAKHQLLKIAAAPSFGKWVRSQVNVNEYGGLMRRMMEEELERKLSATNDESNDYVSGVYSVWYKTNVAADAIVFYTQKPLDGESWILQSTYDVVSGICESKLELIIKKVSCLNDLLH